MEQRTVAQFKDALLAEATVWVRYCGILPEHPHEWTLSFLDITAEQPPPNWSECYWEYPNARLHATTMSGADLWTQLEQSALMIGDIAIVPPQLPLEGLCSIQRRASGSEAVHGRFLWPSDEWTLPFMHQSFNALSGELIGVGSTPSFDTIGSAAAALLDASSRPGGGFDAASFVFRQQSSAARITGILIFPTAVQVSIEGEALAGSELELAGSKPGAVISIESNEPQTLDIPAPLGPGPQAWVLIKRDGRWLDRRFFGYPFLRGQAEDVGYYVEPLSGLQSIIVAGEGPTTEFKGELPAERIRVMKTVAAFCNGDGGLILLGVRKDGSIQGVPDELSSADGLDTLTRLITSWIEPLPSFSLEAVEAEEARRVIVISVEAGTQPPYGAGTTDSKRQYYVRRGATTFHASADQIRHLALARGAQSASAPFGVPNVFEQF